MSARPKCPDCGRATGLGVEATVAVQWRRGAWRVVSDPEVNPDATAGCDHCEWTGNADSVWGEE